MYPHRAPGDNTSKVMKIPTSRRLIASYAANIGLVVAYAAALAITINKL